MGGQSSDLLTDAEKNAYLQGLLEHRLGDWKKLSLPSTTHYNSLHTDEGLHTLGVELCQWLGLKLNGLTIQYRPDIQSMYSFDIKKKQIFVNDTSRKHPYSAAAYLVLAINGYNIHKLSGTAPSKSLVEYSTVYTGLCVWVINALYPVHTSTQKLFHLIDSSWYDSEFIRLSEYSNQQYVDLSVATAHQRHIQPDSYLPRILKRSRQYFSKFTLEQSARFLPEAAITVRHTKLARQFLLKIVLVSAVVGTGVAMGVYLYANRITSDPRQREQAIVVNNLLDDFNSCQERVKESQNSADPNDLFAVRRTDSIKTECISLRNQYNNAVNAYNAIQTN